MAGGGIRCSVASCKSQQGKNKDLSFFSFPKDAQIQKEWINRCRRVDKINVINARICSLHFLPSDFERNFQAELLDLPYRKKLKLHAIPSLLLRCGDTKPIVSSREERSLKKQRREIVAAILEENATTSRYEANKNEELSQSSVSLAEGENKIIKELRNQIDILKKENCDLKLKLENNHLEKSNIIKQYQSQIQILKAVAESSNQENKISFEKRIKGLFSKQFTPNQIDIIMKKKRIVKWTSQELAHAYSLRYFSKRGYSYLRGTLNYPLPGISTLQRWASLSTKSRSIRKFDFSGQK